MARLVIVFFMNNRCRGTNLEVNSDIMIINNEESLEKFLIQRVFNVEASVTHGLDLNDSREDARD